MIETLRGLLGTIEVGAPIDAESLRIFPLRWTIGAGSPYLTLDEAMTAGTIDVTEMSEQGSVPTLKVRNRSDRRVFFMAGEHLVGAKQDRVLNASLMVGAGAELPIPVSCVESGRWRRRSGEFASGGTSSHGSLRAMMSRHASEAYHSEGKPSSQQDEVWREVARKLDAMGSASPTNAFFQVYEDQRVRLGELLASTPAPENACGAAFSAGGKLVGLDLFDRPETLAKLWAKLFNAYALDAIEPTTAEGPAATPPDAEEVAPMGPLGGLGRRRGVPIAGSGKRRPPQGSGPRRRQPDRRRSADPPRIISSDQTPDLVTTGTTDRTIHPERDFRDDDYRRRYFAGSGRGRVRDRGRGRPADAPDRGGSLIRADLPDRSQDHLDRPMGRVRRGPQASYGLETARGHRAVGWRFFPLRHGQAGGTVISGRPIQAPVRLVDGDTFRICDIVFSFSEGVAFPEDPDETPTVAATIDVADPSPDRPTISADLKIRVLLDIGRDLGRALQADEVIDRALDSLFRIFPQAGRGSVFLISGGRRQAGAPGGPIEVGPAETAANLPGDPRPSHRQPRGDPQSGFAARLPRQPEHRDALDPLAHQRTAGRFDRPGLGRDPTRRQGGSRPIRGRRPRRPGRRGWPGWNRRRERPDAQGRDQGG